MEDALALVIDIRFSLVEVGLRRHLHSHRFFRMRTTPQAGADQLFGSYPSRADLLGFLS